MVQKVEYEQQFEMEGVINFLIHDACGVVPTCADLRAKIAYQLRFRNFYSLGKIHLANKIFFSKFRLLKIFLNSLDCQNRKTF